MRSSPAGGLRLLAGAALLCLASTGAAVEAVSYRVDESSSRITVEVRKGGLFGFAGHDHRVLAPRMTGSVELARGDWSAASVTLDIAADGLELDPEVEPPEDLQAVTATMRGERCLDVERYPEIRFRSTRVAVETLADAEAASVRVAGQLTLHGVTREIEIPLRVRLDARRLRASGRVEIRQKDFGIKPVSAAAGTVKVKNELWVQFEIQALAAADAAETQTEVVPADAGGGQ